MVGLHRGERALERAPRAGSVFCVRLRHQENIVAVFWREKAAVVFLRAASLVGAGVVEEAHSKLDGPIDELLGDGGIVGLADMKSSETEGGCLEAIPEKLSLGKNGAQLITLRCGKSPVWKQPKGHGP